MDGVLIIKDLKKEYPSFLLDNISFDLPIGEVTGMIGPNGSGKTTTIKLIMNMVKKDNGSITVLQMDNVKSRNTILEKTGIVFDSHCFVDEWKLKDIKKIYSLFYKDWDNERFDSYLVKFRINTDCTVQKMSKGMQMKLMLACALSYNAELLILDEPTSGLDPVSRDELLGILKNYVSDKKHSVLFSTHITSDLEKIADNIVYLMNGSLIYSGKTSTLMDSYYLIKGDLKALDDQGRKTIIGFREKWDRFEGLLHEDEQLRFQDFETEPASIDDIIVFMERENYEKIIENS